MSFSLSSSRLKFFAIPFFIGLLASIPLWIWGIPTGPDVSHHTRLAAGFYESLNNGDIYPSWISMTNNGYGDPSSRFYPPLLYLTLSFFRYLSADWFFAFLLTFTLFNLISSLGMFLWANELAENTTASGLSAIVFLLVPFHTNELYSASLFANYLAVGLMPFVFYFIGKLIKNGGWQNVGGVGLSLALVVYSHVPMAIFCAICVVLYSVILWFRNKSFLTVAQLSVGALLGVLITAGYWVTMLSEIKWKNPSGAEQGEFFDYRNNFLFQQSLDSTANWWLETMLIAMGTLFSATLILLFKKDKKSFGFFGLVFFTFFMATPMSRFIWDKFSFLQETQFPWRWLSLTSMFLAILISLSYIHILEIWKSRYRPFAIILGGIILIPLSFTVSQIIRTANYLDRDALNQTVAEYHTKRTNQDFLPIWTTREIKSMSTPVESSRNINILEWNEKRRFFEVGEGNAEQARVKLLYYPHWKATTETNELLETLPDKDGALLISLPPNSARISVNFVEPTIVKASTFLTLIGVVISMFLLFLKRNRSQL